MVIKLCPQLKNPLAALFAGVQLHPVREKGYLLYHLCYPSDKKRDRYLQSLPEAYTIVGRQQPSEEFMFLLLQDTLRSTFQKLGRRVSSRLRLTVVDPDMRYTSLVQNCLTRVNTITVATDDADGYLQLAQKVAEQTGAVMAVTDIGSAMDGQREPLVINPSGVPLTGGAGRIVLGGGGGVPVLPSGCAGMDIDTAYCLYLDGQMGQGYLFCDELQVADRRRMGLSEFCSYVQKQCVDRVV